MCFSFFFWLYHWLAVWLGHDFIQVWSLCPPARNEILRVTDGLPNWVCPKRLIADRMGALARLWMRTWFISDSGIEFLCPLLPAAASNFFKSTLMIQNVLIIKRMSRLLLLKYVKERKSKLLMVRTEILERQTKKSFYAPHKGAVFRHMDQLALKKKHLSPLTSKHPPANAPTPDPSSAWMANSGE